MRECERFEKRLVASIPYRFRYEVEAILRSFQQSHVMLDIYAQAVRMTSLPDVGDPHFPIVVAFGSFGRLDGAVNISDYDVMFLYPGPTSKDHIAVIRNLIRAIVSTNRALMFDHREDIENGTFDYDSSPAYPVVATDELFRPEGEVRALQILTEGRCINPTAAFSQLLGRLTERFGYTDNVHAFDFKMLRESLTRMKSNYCNGVLGRLRTHRTPLTNRKILKLFSLREFSHLANLFALAEVAIASSARACDSAHAAEIVSSPSILKIAAFAEPSGSFATLLNGLAPAVRHSVAETAKAHAERLPPESGIPLSAETTDVGEGELITAVRVLLLAVLRDFDSLLQLLHDPTFLSVIDPLEPDITTWIGYRQFARVLERRQQLLDSCKLLAQALSTMVLQVAQSARAPVLDDARLSLRAISDYTLELELPRRT